MQLSAPAILLAARAHGETAVIARMLTEQHGMVAAYVAGGRGRQLRPVVIPGNIVQAEIRAKSDSQLPFARLELVASRGPWLGEPLAASAINWVTALTASALPERNPYPTLHSALGGLLDAICSADSARQWVEALAVYEALLLRELGATAIRQGGSFVSSPNNGADYQWQRWTGPPWNRSSVGAAWTSPGSYSPGVTWMVSRSRMRWHRA